MQIGLFYQIQVPKPWNAESETQRYWEMLEEVSYAEEMGMESVWFVEHHFRFEWSHSSAPDLTLAAISQRTERMRLGIAVTLAPLHHPLHVASRMATLDILSKGRVNVGLGRSGYPYQMQPYGTDLKDVSGMLEEYLDILPGAWTQQEFSYDGQYFQIPPREVVPKPFQKPHPPIWQACSQDDTASKDWVAWPRPVSDRKGLNTLFSCIGRRSRTLNRRPRWFMRRWPVTPLGSVPKIARKPANGAPS